MGNQPVSEHHDQHEPSTSMDLGEHVRTWKNFTAMIKWNLIGAAIIMLLLLLFRTNS
jgi:hypothetical protein